MRYVGIDETHWMNAETGFIRNVCHVFLYFCFRNICIPELLNPEEEVGDFGASGNWTETVGISWL